jgi:hypothetical protein
VQRTSSAKWFAPGGLSGIVCVIDPPSSILSTHQNASGRQRAIPDVPDEVNRTDRPQ